MSPEFYLTIFTALIGFSLGACLGSFASALIWRIPLQKPWFYEIKKGQKDYVRSECTTCNRTLTFYDLIPIFSWIFQKGQCRKCHKSISIIYPILEAVFGLLCLVLFLGLGLSFLALIASFLLIFSFVFIWVGLKNSVWSKEILLILIFLALLFIVFTGF